MVFPKYHHLISLLENPITIDGCYDILSVELLTKELLTEGSGHIKM